MAAPHSMHRQQQSLHAVQPTLQAGAAYSQGVNHPYSQAQASVSGRLQVQPQQAGQALNVAGQQLHSQNAPLIPGLQAPQQPLQESRVPLPSGVHLPPRPVTKNLRGESLGAVSGAIEEAKHNAQEIADQFARNRKRIRKQMEQGKPKDPVTEEEKKLSPTEIKKKRYSRRLELNRQSAAVSRVRRRAYVEELEDKLVSVEREKLKLEGQVSVMQDENTKLREQMRQLREQLSGPGATRAPVPYPPFSRTEPGKQ